ncbi:MAG: radical SAM protein [Solobacterium sp.]|nr:radical SAM protein [Solobacterium sp.]
MNLQEKKIIQSAGRLDFLTEKQRYHAYPARYRKNAHWSLTGACNMRCRHCFMSAPHKKHVVPELKELLNIAEQLAECGVFSVGLTGGEPLMREDFGEIVEALSTREIRITEIYTNGWLVNEALLNMLERNGQRPSFQLSYNGKGMHDYLRGIPGAEERVTEALKLMNQRNFRTSVSMCLHRKNKDTPKDTVSYLADLGVSAFKCSSIMELGEWTNAETEKLRLSRQEELEVYEQYIPQYFAENAPLSLELSGAFLYERGMNRWHSFYHRECSKDREAKMPACSSLRMAFYIGPDGVVASCQGMCDCNFAKNFPKSEGETAAGDPDGFKVCKPQPCHRQGCAERQ